MKSKGEVRHCIHGRTENQKCKLCGLVSFCCEAAVIQEGNTTKFFRCDQCHKPCDALSEPSLLQARIDKHVQEIVQMVGGRLTEAIGASCLVSLSNPKTQSVIARVKIEVGEMVQEYLLTQAKREDIIFQGGVPRGKS